MIAALVHSRWGCEGPQNTSRYCCCCCISYCNCKQLCFCYVCDLLIGSCTDGNVNVQNLFISFFRMPKISVTVYLNFYMYEIFT
uniref:Uncharacterized protein n=1 Tax=Oryza brachyantha TaxID=4533 RepID=J3L870_ORYBR